mgnify:CR=1 FL=1
MKNYIITFIGAVLATSILLITLIFDIDLFEAAIALLEGFEEFEVDEIIIPALIFLVFTFIDLNKRQKKQKIELEKIKIYEAMMSSTHHILNNFINQILLFKITAEKTPGFNPKVLALYDQIHKDATTQIEALGNISEINEKSIHASVAPKDSETDGH